MLVQINKQSTLVDSDSAKPCTIVYEHTTEHKAHRLVLVIILEILGRKSGRKSARLIQD